jgi:hypothetical protein
VFSSGGRPGPVGARGTLDRKHSGGARRGAVWWHSVMVGRLVAAGGFLAWVGWGQVGAGRSGIQGRPRMASRRTRILSRPFFAALDT